MNSYSKRCCPIGECIATSVSYYTCIGLMCRTEFQLYIYIYIQLNLVITNPLGTDIKVHYIRVFTITGLQDIIAKRNVLNQLFVISG